MSTIHRAATRKVVSDTVSSTEEAELSTTILKTPGGDPTEFKNVAKNQPMPSDIDSVYAQEIDVDNSDIGDFSGVITDYFDDLFSISTNTTATNPKIIKVWFKHSIQLYNIGFGCNESGKNFSNIKIKLFGSNEFIRETVDDSANDTKYTSKTYSLEPSKANGVIIEFHTADEICLSNIVIWKALDVNARLAAISEVTGEVENIKSRDGSLNVSIEYKDNVISDYYLYRTDATPTITSNASIDDTVINIDSNAGITDGDAITFYEGKNVSQSLVVSSTATTVTISSLLDFAFTTAATVEVGPWNMAVDGSVTPQIFSIRAPADKGIHVQSLTISMADKGTMDDSTFGGIVGGLTNGILLRLVNGITKNHAVIVNNLGFWEIGFDTEYTQKTALVYGFRARKLFASTNGVLFTIESGGTSKYQLHIRDDLTGDEHLLAAIVHGHISV